MSLLPGGVELHQDQVLGHREVCEGVPVEDVDAIILDDVVVSLGLLQGIQVRLEIPIVLPESCKK